MRKLSQLISVIFHPIFVPLAAVSIFFYKLPIYFESSIIYSKIIAMLIISIFLPLVFLYLFRTLRLISNFELPTAKERRLPLLFFMILDLVIINYIFELYNYQYLFYFFWSLLLASMVVFLALFFRFKISLHSLGMSSLLTFLIILSFNFQLNFIYGIAFLVVCLGLVSSSRLILKAHVPSEVIVGIVLGVITQLTIPIFRYYKM
ncbi:MAG: phosphatase PAP2 family protein [Psychroflexus halocasei]